MKIKNKNQNVIFFGVMLCPYIKTGTKNVSKCRPHSSEDIYAQGKTIENQYMGQNVKILYIFGYLRGPGGGSIMRLGLSCYAARLTPI